MENRVPTLPFTCRQWGPELTNISSSWFKWLGIMSHRNQHLLLCVITSSFVYCDLYYYIPSTSRFTWPAVHLLLHRFIPISFFPFYTMWLFYIVVFSPFSITPICSSFLPFLITLTHLPQYTEKKKKTKRIPWSQQDTYQSPQITHLGCFTSLLSTLCLL